MIPEVSALPRRARVAVLTVAALVIALAGCGDKKKDKPASQTAAKVNKEEITVHQINFVLQQQRALAPEQAASASRLILDRLVDQELALQKAQDQKLDRESGVVQQIEASRRDIIARAYLEKIGSGASKPTPVEVKAYYEAHPALFSERRIYNLQELTIQAKPDQVAALQARLAASKDVPDFIAYLKANDFKFGANQAVRAAEQLPLSSLDKLAKLQDGQNLFNAGSNGVQVLILAGSRIQPIDAARATPAIEQFILNERKRKLVEDDLKALRGAAKIEYMGDYANERSSDVKTAAPAPEITPLTATTSPAAEGLGVRAAPQTEVEPTQTVPASAPTAGTLEKGIKGFK